MGDLDRDARKILERFGGEAPAGEAPAARRVAAGEARQAATAGAKVSTRFVQKWSGKTLAAPAAGSQPAPGPSVRSADAR